MPQSHPEQQGFFVADTVQRTWLPIGVALDKLGTQHPENFIHIIDHAKGEFAVSAIDASTMLDDDAISRAEWGFVEKMPHQNARGYTPTTQEQRDRATFTRDKAGMQDVLAVEFKFDGREPGLVARLGLRSTTVDVLTPAELGNVQFMDEIKPSREHLLDASVGLERLSGMLKNPPYLVKDVKRGVNVPIDLSTTFEHIYSDEFDEMVRGTNRSHNIFTLHNARLMAIANRVHAQFMHVNGIPGLSRVRDPEGLDTVRYSTIQTAPEGAELVGGLTSPLYEPEDFINHCNTRAFLENPQQPDFPFTEDRLVELVHLRNEARQQHINNSGLTQRLGDLMAQEYAQVPEAS